jgi:uncharacterized pyridoxal phosphate-containing UPF0001 family protein
LISLTAHYGDDSRQPTTRANPGWPQACARAGRPASVTLLAVSKTFHAAAVREACTPANGFGENYVQEALDKIAALGDLRPGSGTCIGPLQSNKTRRGGRAL